MTAPPKDQSDEDLEQLMTELGVNRYRNRVAKAAVKGRRTDTKSGRAMLREAVHRLEAGVREFRKAAKKRAGSGHSSAALLDGLHPAVVAFVAARAVLDGVALQQPLTALANAVGAAVEAELRLKGVRRAASQVVKERAEGPGLDKVKGKGTSLWPDVKRRLRRHARGGAGKKRRIEADIAAKAGAHWDAWPRRDRIRLGVTLVELLRVHTGLIEVRTVPRDGRRPHAVVVATDAALNWLESADARNELLTPFYLPMRTRPADWTDAWSGGYRLNAMVRRPAVKTRSRAAVEAVAKAQPEIVLRAMSTVQRTPWRVNAGVYRVAKHLWDSGFPIAGFQERLDDPCPPWSPPGAGEEEKERSIRARADWRKRFHQNRGRRVLAAKTMHLAEVHKSVPEFYFPVQADFRGRLYPQPFFLQYQGDDLARGLLEFAKGKVIRDRDAADWFRGAGAGLFGVNRVVQARRVEWAHQHHEKILATAADPVGFKWWLDAESPFQFLGWALEYAAWTQAPAQFESRFRVPLDGSCNGLQLYSLLARDAEGARATNVTPADAPADIYQVVADRATERVLLDPDPYAAQWLEFLGGRVTRAYTKRATMTLPYGSTFHSCVNYIRDALEADRQAGRRSPFEALNGGGYRAASWLGRHVWDAIGDTVGKARGTMEWLRAVSDLATKHNVPLAWTAPSGWPVVQAYTRFESARISTAVGDRVRFVRYREDTAELAPVQQANGIAPNYIHSLDSAILAFAVVRARERKVTSIATVHDSFAVPAADAAKMAQVLREVVADVFTPDLLAEFRDEVQAQMPAGVQLPPLPEQGTLNPRDVLGAQYAYY